MSGALSCGENPGNFWRGAAGLAVCSQPACPCRGPSAQLSRLSERVSESILLLEREATRSEMIPRQASPLPHARGLQGGGHRCREAERDRVGAETGSGRRRGGADTGRPRGPFAHLNRCTSISGLWHRGKLSPSLNGTIFVSAFCFKPMCDDNAQNGFSVEGRWEGSIQTSTTA